MNHIIEHRRQFVERMKGMYTNADKLTTQEMSVEEFQKSYPAESFVRLTTDVMKGYISKAIEGAKEAQSKEVLQKAATEINAYTPILVKSENGIDHRFYVRSKDEIAKAKKTEVIGKTQSGKDVYDHPQKGKNTIEGYTKQDHLDASKMHKDKMKSFKEGDSEYEHHKKQSEFHEFASKDANLKKSDDFVQR